MKTDEFQRFLTHLKAELESTEEGAEPRDLNQSINNAIDMINKQQRKIKRNQEQK